MDHRPGRDGGSVVPSLLNKIFGTEISECVLVPVVSPTAPASPGFYTESIDTCGDPLRRLAAEI
jgi:hypothetical protein